MKKYTIGLITIEDIFDKGIDNHLICIVQSDQVTHLYHYLEILALGQEKVLQISLDEIEEALQHPKTQKEPVLYELIEEGLLAYAVFGGTTMMHRHYLFDDSDGQYEEGLYYPKGYDKHNIDELREKVKTQQED